MKESYGEGLANHTSLESCGNYSNVVAERSRFVDQQKKRRHLFKKLIKRGVSYGLASTVFSNNGRWVTSNTFALTKAYIVEWFIDQAGQWIRSNQRMRDWFPLRQWNRVT